MRSRCRVHGRPLLAGIVVAMVLTGPASGQTAGEKEAARQVGLAASQALGQALLTELTAALEAGGPANAMGVCARRAWVIADSLSASLGVGVWRISDRNRNPLGAPSAEEVRALQAFSREGAPEDTVFSTVDSTGETYYRYMKPIRISKATCLRCHGGEDSIDASTAERLRALYPGDRATGYKYGDLRGAFTVRIPAEVAARRAGGGTAE